MVQIIVWSPPPSASALNQFLDLQLSNVVYYCNSRSIYIICTCAFKLILTGTWAFWLTLHGLRTSMHLYKWLHFSVLCEDRYFHNCGWQRSLIHAASNLSLWEASVGPLLSISWTLRVLSCVELCIISSYIIIRLCVSSSRSRKIELIRMRTINTRRVSACNYCSYANLVSMII